MGLRFPNNHVARHTIILAERRWLARTSSFHAVIAEVGTVSHLSDLARLIRDEKLAIIL